MKKLSLLLILMAVSVSFAVAADIDTKSGNKDILFSFKGLDSLDAGTYLGGIGMRYYLADELAIRPQVMFTYNKLTDKTTDPDTKVTTTGIGLNVGLEKHMTPMMKSLSPYLGASVGFNYGKVKHEEPGEGGVTVETEAKVTTFDIGLLAGFEWGFTDGLALGGEYNIGLQSASMKAGDTDVGSALSFGINTASLMLTVHW